MQSSLVTNYKSYKKDCNLPIIALTVAGLSLSNSFASNFPTLETNWNVSDYSVTKQNIIDNKLSILNSFFAIEDEKTKEFISTHQLTDFLAWLNQPIINIFGTVKKTLGLFKCWDEQDYHLEVTVYSELDDMDKLTELESELFEILEQHPNVDHALHYIVIAQG